MNKTFDDKVPKYPENAEYTLLNSDGHYIVFGSTACGLPLRSLLIPVLEHLACLESGILHALPTSKLDEIAEIRLWGPGTQTSEKIEIILKKDKTVIAKKLQEEFLLGLKERIKEGNEQSRYE